jgi:hypothetical protein
VPVPIRQERHVLLPKGTPAERIAAALEPAALAAALRTRIVLQSLQHTLASSVVPAVVPPPLDQVAEALERFLAQLEEPKAKRRRRR